MSKREKKSSGIKIWLPILCIVIVAITFFMIHDMQNKIEEHDNMENLNLPANEMVDEDMTENEFVENKTIENVAEENAKKATTTENKAKEQQTATPGITDKKQKAIELVKKEWGEDDSVDYVFDYVNENGEYVVAVKDRASATVKFYFRVNLEKESVELD